MNSFWNERYGQRDFVYGETPNVFFAETLGTLKQGTIILPCDGEGRNAVHAARQGWEVNAFDLSEAGNLMHDNGVNISTRDSIKELGMFATLSERRMLLNCF